MHIRHHTCVCVFECVFWLCCLMRKWCTAGPIWFQNHSCLCAVWLLLVKAKCVASERTLTPYTPLQCDNKVILLAPLSKNMWQVEWTQLDDNMHHRKQRQSSHSCVAGMLVLYYMISSPALTPTHINPCCFVDERIVAKIDLMVEIQAFLTSAQIICMSAFSGGQWGQFLRNYENLFCIACCYVFQNLVSMCAILWTFHLHLIEISTDADRTSIPRSGSNFIDSEHEQ